ncbi:MAG: Lrp/AsnC family transcriptional regulator [Ignavibacteriales bacterium]|nr:Lrp/AsnC family transcriptional regulator [Ignavibacteriales bacterium]
MIDEIDIKILNILQNHGRTRRNEIAEYVGLSIPSVSDRLRKLEDSGFIIQYTTHINPKKVGKDITAFIAVKVDSSKHYPAFIEKAKGNDDVLECHAITGDGSHLLKIRTENAATLENLLSKIQSWNGVTDTRTSIVLSTAKETMKINITTKR